MLTHKDCIFQGKLRVAKVYLNATILHVGTTGIQKKFKRGGCHTIPLYSSLRPQFSGAHLVDCPLDPPLELGVWNCNFLPCFSSLYDMEI